MAILKTYRKNRLDLFLRRLKFPSCYKAKQK
jgi:hypothetical protein